MAVKRLPQSIGCEVESIGLEFDGAERGFCQCVVRAQKDIDGFERDIDLLFGNGAL
jgi:hypothetical protein